MSAGTGREWTSEAHSATPNQKTKRLRSGIIRRAKNGNERRAQGLERIPNPFLFAERFARALIERLTPNRRQMLALFQFLLVLALAAGLWLAFHFTSTSKLSSRLFQLQRIAITGANELSETTIREMIKDQMGMSLLAIDSDTIRSTLQTHPWIQSASIRRSFPHTLRVRIVEREPRALVLVAGQLWLISDEIEAFKVVEQGDPIDLPVVTGIDESRFATEPDYRRSALLDALALLADYRSSGLEQYDSISEIQLRSFDRSLSLVLEDSGIVAHLGSAPYRQKLRRLGRVLAKARREEWAVSTIRLDNRRDPGRVAVRLTPSENEAVPAP